MGVAHQRSIGDAPGPSGFGLIRTFRGLRSDPLGTLEKAAERFGPIVRFSMPTRARSFVLVHEPEHVREVLADQTGRYSKETASYADLRPLLGRGILTAEGAAWRAQRRLVTPCLNAARAHTLLDTTHALTRELAARWRSRELAGERFDIRRDMVWLTLGILARSLFESDARA